MRDNWFKMINESMVFKNDSWSNVEQNTMTDEDMNLMFDTGFGHTEGIPFTVWTHDFIYFPVCYDGREWVGSVSRNPDGKPTYHFGS